MALNSVLSWFIKKRIHQIDLFRKYPHEVQKEWFEELIRMGQTTQFGEQQGFSQVKTINDFRKATPIQGYEDIKPLVERCMDGEQNILWPTEIKWFAKSSGTTSSRSKFIPVSKEALEDCHYKGGKDLLSIYYNLKPNADLYTGKSLMVGGTSEVIKTSKEAYFGDLSAIIIKNLPFWADIKRTPSREIALMSQWDEKIQAMAEATMKDDVTNISGVPSWTLILLQRVLEIAGTDNIHDIWPNLELYMHGGVNFSPYLPEFQKIMDCSKVSFLESYNASEGIFGIQDNLNEPDLLLMLDYGIFYEFIPLSEYGSQNPICLSLHEVETGITYVPVITTNGGLWRYVPGDTITFTNLSPYKIVVTGRTKSFINAFGEELMVSNTDKALEITCSKHNTSVLEYTAAPIFLSSDKGGHEWIIELSNNTINRQQFVEDLDYELCQLNSDYAAKRKGSMALNLPTVHFAERDCFLNWLKSKGKTGGQNKVPRLANDRKFIDEILGIAVN
jgi:hypothetical protein